MSDTYEEIIEEIERLDASADNYTRYLNKHGLKKCHNWASTDMALDIARRVREVVGGDPSDWWVEDADGNHVHIGDVVTNGGYKHKIALLGDGDVMDEKTSFVCMSSCTKVVPDTREKIIKDAMAKFSLSIIPSHTQDVIEEAVDRAMKLGADQ